MTEHTLTRARAGDEQAFRELTDPYRYELQAHCYRILGSVQDAEDILQETLLAAWRGLRGFEGRASLRTWLYRIATNRCLNARRDGARRPNGLVAVAESSEVTRRTEALGLEPYPDALLDGVADLSPGPEALYDMKEAVTLAFVAALHHLPPQQRAVLVLRDVLGFRAAEVAHMLENSEDSVNSALKRARAAIEARLRAAEGRRAPAPHSSRERELVKRFAEAFQNKDVDRVVALLTDDARLAMPPASLEYHGRVAAAAFLRNRLGQLPGRTLRLVPTRANTQPAFGLYPSDPHKPIARRHGLIVLTLRDDRISAITRFSEGSITPHFGLPPVLRE